MNVARFSAASLLALALALSAPPSRAAADTSAHRPGLRDQWQPQTEHDARLQQSVRIEILGRAAVPALEMLSKETGVTLQVAPENLDTVGERKLTVIAQGCSLKSIMVQIPNALQECHWDVVGGATEPIYLLHRDSGASVLMQQLAEAQTKGRTAAGRASRAARVALAREALSMPPEELERLEETDPLLARAAQDERCREAMSAFLSLPQERIAQFVDDGEVSVAFAAAPPELQAYARRSVQRWIEETAAKVYASPKAIEGVKLVLEMIEKATIVYVDYDHWPEIDGGDGFGLRVVYRDSSGRGANMGIDTEGTVAAIPPRLPVPARLPGDDPYRGLFERTGSDPDEATALLLQLEGESDRAVQALQEEQRAAQRIEPSGEALHRVVVLPTKEALAPVEVQRMLAQATGYSVIADYFTPPGRFFLPEEAATGLPLWALLYEISDLIPRGPWVWTAAGDCLVIRHEAWYVLLLAEPPESLLEQVRTKLEEQGRLTLDDIGAVAARLAQHRPRFRDFDFPPDLERAGLSRQAAFSPLLVLYAALSPSQREQARSEGGLAYRELTLAQQELVRDVERNAPRSVPPEQSSLATFRVTGTAPQGCLLSLKSPDFSVEVRVPVAAAGPLPSVRSGR